MDLYRSGKMLKHVGVFSGRKIIVLMPDPSDLNYVFVIEAERLPFSLEEIAVREVETANAQSRVWFSQHVHGLEYDGVNMIRFLFGTPAATSRASIKDVLMVPKPGTQLPLTQVYSTMLENTPELAQAYAKWKASGQASPVAQPNTPAEPNFTVSSHNDSVDQNENSRAIARNLIVQAQLLQADADAKFKEAYKYDPSLDPELAEGNSAWTDDDTGKSYKTEAALKAAISRRENAKVK